MKFRDEFVCNTDVEMFSFILNLFEDLLDKNLG
jgi:hypothetical protein